MRDRASCTECCNWRELGTALLHQCHQSDLSNASQEMEQGQLSQLWWSFCQFLNMWRNCNHYFFFLKTYSNPLKSYRKTKPNRWRNWTKQPRNLKWKYKQKRNLEIRTHRWKHYQQNRRGRRNNLRGRRHHKNHWNNHQINRKRKQLLTQNIQKIRTQWENQA